MVISKFTTEDGVTIFRLSGKLISATLDKLKSGLDNAIAESGCKIVVNLENADVVDSVAAGLLISRRKMAKKKDGFLEFCGLQPAVEKLFALADLDNPLETHPSEEEAIASIRGLVKARD